MTRDYDGSKKWYLQEVVKELMGEYGLSQAQAEEAIERFQLKDKLDADPERQLKEEPYRTALVMKKAGLLLGLEDSKD